jgi:hypothetical protein
VNGHQFMSDIVDITPAQLQKLARAGDVVLSEQARLQLNDAFREFQRTFENSEAWSSGAVAATRRFATYRSLNALKKLMSFRPAFVLVVYETTLVHSRANQVDADARADEIRRIVDGLPKHVKNPGLPREAKDLITGAQRRVKDLDGIKRRSRRSVNSHVTLLVVRVARIFEDAGGSARIGRDEGHFDRFLRQLYKYLPQLLQPPTERALVRYAKEGLRTFHRETEVWKRVGQGNQPYIGVSLGSRLAGRRSPAVIATRPQKSANKCSME